MDMQNQLIQLVNFIVRNYSDCKNLRGVTAFWRESDHTVCLSFYFDGLISNEDLEDSYDIGAGIIAHFPNGLLEESYNRLDYPKPLPTSVFWGYKRIEK